MWSRRHEQEVGPSDEGNDIERQPNPLVARFKQLVGDIVVANQVKPDNSGISTHTINHDGWYIDFIDFGPEPEGYGKPILWIKFKPTHGIRVRFSDQQYLFTTTDGDESSIQRGYRYGSLMPRHGLPNLFTSQRKLDKTQTESLISYVEAPHLHFEDLHQLLTLEPEECAELEISNNETAEHNATLQRDLEALQRWHIPRGNIG